MSKPKIYLRVNYTIKTKSTHSNSLDIDLIFDGLLPIELSPSKRVF
jgi:hypothetical protein